MDAYYERVKDYLLELNFTIVQEDAEDSVIVVENEEQGIANIVLIVAEPMLIVEQLICELDTDGSVYQQLLIKNRDIIHGAFALDETGTKLFFRNTHECENLDLNELEATLNSLAILLSEYSDELIKISK